MNVRMYVCMYVCVCVRMFVCVCIYAWYMYVNMHVWEEQISGADPDGFSPGAQPYRVFDIVL